MVLNWILNLDIGDVLHKFSHIHQTYRVLHVLIDGDQLETNCGESSNHEQKNNQGLNTIRRQKANHKQKTIGQEPNIIENDHYQTKAKHVYLSKLSPGTLETQWMREDELRASGISTAMKKVFDLFRSKKLSRENDGSVANKPKRQKTISSYFE